MLQTFLTRIFASSDELDELLFDGADAICLVSGDQRRYQRSPFADFPDWQRELQTFALKQGLRWDPLHPAAGGSFSLCIGDQEEHFRWHGLLPPIARDGILLSIRRHRLGRFQLSDFLHENFLTEFRRSLDSDTPVLVMGPTGSGKTSLLMTLLLDICADERLAVIEQIPEIPRLSKRWLRLCARPAGFGGEGSFSLETIVDELLRLRPDRIVIGELRREELPAFRRALLAGHRSIWTTLHAGHAEQIPRRLAEMDGSDPREWQELLGQQEAKVIALKRQTPRVLGVWQFRQLACESLISCV